MLERNEHEIEERAAKCNICAGELTIIENMLYGNRCIFCATEFKWINFWPYIINCFFDFKIYVFIKKLIIKVGHSEARILFLGCISELGFIDIAGVKKSRDKRRLCRIIRRYL